VDGPAALWQNVTVTYCVGRVGYWGTVGGWESVSRGVSFTDFGVISVAQR